MSDTIKSSFLKVRLLFINSASLIFISASEIAAQVTSVRVTPAAERQEDFTWWYGTLFLLFLGLVGAIFWWLNSKKTKTVAVSDSKSKNNNNNWESNSVDADKELEWLRKNKKLVGKKDAPKAKRKKRTSDLPVAKSNLSGGATSVEENSSSELNEQSSVILPIFSIQRLELARPFDELPLSNDDSLMDAIEQVQDEFEEDEEIRELTLRVLTAFRTKNSVEALSQAALYDLSSSLRSKAVTILSEFDHESVFETILLACAEPTREVRAAAARGLTKLTFDRADAWTRIAETGEEGRMVQAARAAIESGFVDMSFDRLVHQDHKHAYEAFTLMALLIKSGETEKIFNALESNRDMNVRKAVLHTIKVTKDQRALDGLYSLLEKNSLPIELQEEVDKTIEEIGFVTA
jgi:HEAT repeat protein